MSTLHKGGRQKLRRGDENFSGFQDILSRNFQKLDKKRSPKTVKETKRDTSQKLRGQTRMIVLSNSSKTREESVIINDYGQDESARIPSALHRQLHFVQSQHESMLDRLHEEIERLRRVNRDLQHKLVMCNCASSSDKNGANQEVRTLISNLRAQLKAEQEKSRELMDKMVEYEKIPEEWKRKVDEEKDQTFAKDYNHIIHVCDQPFSGDLQTIEPSKNISEVRYQCETVDMEKHIKSPSVQVDTTHLDNNDSRPSTYNYATTSPHPPPDLMTTRQSVRTSQVKSVKTSRASTHLLPVKLPLLKQLPLTQAVHLSSTTQLQHNPAPITKQARSDHGHGRNLISEVSDAGEKPTKTRSKWGWSQLTGGGHSSPSPTPSPAFNNDHKTLINNRNNSQSAKSSRGSSLSATLTPFLPSIRKSVTESMAAVTNRHHSSSGRHRKTPRP